MSVDLSHYELLPIFLVSLAVILAASEAGRRLGMHVKTRGGDEISTLEAGVLGLLALMISFTFAMALSRFEARRDTVLKEANAIGTTALRARLLPAPHDAETLKLLREYVQLRVDSAQGMRSAVETDAVIARSTALQEALWQQAKAAAAKESGMVPTGVFIQSLNEMIDDQAKRLAAIRNRVPNIVLLALYGIAAVASAFTGYAGGIEARGSRMPVYVMGILVSAVILLIQDLDRPGSGFIRVSQQPMLDAAPSLAAYPE
jgi:hypothetical protein